MHCHRHAIHLLKIINLRKVLGKVKIGYIPRINRGFKGKTEVILLTWNQCLGKGLVLKKKKCMCHVKARVADTAVTQVMQRVASN